MPVIALAGEEPRGIKGKAYTGRVVLAGSSGAKVAVSLVWGSGAADRQSTLLTPSEVYKTDPLKFAAGAGADAGHIEISGTGQGSSLGAVSDAGG